MLEIDGIPPKLSNQVCEALICQQYWYQGKLEQEVDALFIKVNEHWHRLYFDAGIVFWRIQEDAPKPVESQATDPFVYPLIDVSEKFDIKNCIITDYATEPMLEGVQVSIVFENKGSLIITHSDNKTALRFIRTT